MRHSKIEFFPNLLAYNDKFELNMTILCFINLKPINTVCNK